MKFVFSVESNNHNGFSILWKVENSSSPFIPCARINDRGQISYLPYLSKSDCECVYIVAWLKGLIHLNREV